MNSIDLAKKIGGAYNLLPEDIEHFVKKYKFKSFMDYAFWRTSNKITNDQLHEEIMTALMES